MELYLISSASVMPGLGKGCQAVCYCRLGETKGMLWQPDCFMS